MDKTNLHKRKGKIFMDHATIMPVNNHVFGEYLKELFSVFYPIRIEELQPQWPNEELRLMYYGYSPLFEEIEIGEEIPEYKVHTQENINSDYAVKAMERIYIDCAGSRNPRMNGR